MRVFRTTFAALLTLPACDVAEVESIDAPTLDQLDEDARELARPTTLPAGLSADLDVDPEAISNGGTYDSDRDVKITWGSDGVCSGTLLRNDVVLTARHCLTTNGDQDGPLRSPSEFIVWQDGPGDSFVAASYADTIAANYEDDDSSDEFIDVGLLRTTWAFEIDGRLSGESTEIFRGSETALKNNIVLCQGYGKTDCSQADPPGLLKGGLVEINGSAGNVPNWELDYIPFNGWLQSFGDSGSSCRTPVFVAPNRRRVLGVMSHGFPCQSGVAHEVAPNRYRTKVQGTMATWAGDFLDTFSATDAPYETVEPTQANGDWIQTGAWLLQNGDAVGGGTYYEGSKAIHGGEVVENGVVSVDVWNSWSFDTVYGLVGRMRDDTHYYRFAVDEATGTVRIDLRDGDDWTLLDIGHATLSPYGWNTIKLEMTGPNILGYVNGELVAHEWDADHTYLAGRVGVYNFGDTPTYFDNLTVDRW